MAKLALRIQNLFFLSSNTSPPQNISVFHSQLKPRGLSLFPSKVRLKLRVLCSIKENPKFKERKTLDGVLVRLRMEEMDSSVSDSEEEFGLEGGSTEMGFDWNWPPWKNIPQRYKLIVATALAFVVCNMDKVVV